MKTTHSFTPGPWKVGEVASVVGRVIWRGDMPANTNHVRICRNVATEADARLIAAAPRMFDRIAKLAAQGDAEAIKIMEAVNGNA